MSALFSLMWGVIGFVWMIAGKPFLECAACFLICGVFSGAAEMVAIRRDFEKIIIVKGEVKEEYDD